MRLEKDDVCAGPIATAASVQLDACITNFIIQEWFPYRDPKFYQLVEEAFELQVEDGRFAVPDTPGLGVILNEEVMETFSSIHIS